jgi:hypothetical protein
MKKIFFVLSLLYSIISFGQISSGGDRICGSEFSRYGLEGKTIRQALDWAGQTHNDYQEDLLQKLSVAHPDFADTIALKSIVTTNSEAFFSAKGLNYNETVHSLNLNKSVIIQIQQAAYSREALTLMNQFKGKMDAYDPNNDVEFFSTLKALKESALNLTDDKEAFEVGVPIAVAIHSLDYWKVNGQRWLDVFTSYDQGIAAGNKSSGQAGTQRAAETGPGPKVNLVKLGGADVAGAVSGAIGGSVLGPGGALAMGILSSATSSLGNLANQVISHFLSGWIF